METIQPTTQAVVLRPEWTAAAKRQAKAAAVFATAVCAVWLAVALAFPSVLPVALVIITVGWYVGLPFLHFRRARLIASEAEIGKRDLWGRSLLLPVSKVEAIRRARAGRRATKILVEDRAGDPKLSFYTTTWSSEQLAQW